METIRQNKALIIVGVLFIALIAILLTSNNDASDAQQTPKTDVNQMQQADDTKSTNDAKTSAATPAEPKKADYKYVAQPGDGYSQLARKAIQTYGIINKISLSRAQIIAAETQLTQAAGSPLLDEGQTIQFDTTAIKNFVESVQKLSADELAAWSTYVSDVDFDTQQIGE